MYIHGIDDNPVYEMALKKATYDNPDHCMADTLLRQQDQEDSVKAITTEGKEIPQELTNTLTEWFQKQYDIMEGFYKDKEIHEEELKDKEMQDCDNKENFNEIGQTSTSEIERYVIDQNGESAMSDGKLKNGEQFHQDLKNMKMKLNTHNYAREINRKCLPDHCKISSLDSVESFVWSGFAEFCRGRDEKECEVFRRLLNNQLLWECVLSGCATMRDVSLAAFGSYMENPGGNLEVEDGFVKILEYMIKEVDKECVQLCKPVKKISMVPGTATRPKQETSAINAEFPIKDADDEGCITVEFENGDVEVFDHVIVTCSLNYLKLNHERLFDPPLPQHKQQAINRHGMGTVNKIFLRFGEDRSDNQTQATMDNGKSLVDEFFPKGVRKILIIHPTSQKSSDEVGELEWTSAIHSVWRVTGKADTIMCK